MGDIQDVIRGVVGTAAAGIVGLAHGGLDSAYDGASQGIPELGHVIMTYLPFLGAAAYTAATPYLGTPRRIKSGVRTACFAAGAEFLGYWTGRIVVAGARKVIER